MSDDTSVTWLTQEAFDRLHRRTRAPRAARAATEIAKKIEAAREEGDLKENGGYHAAKEEQGKIEARIRVLTELLRTATVGDAPESHGVVEPGTVVTATIAGRRVDLPDRQPRDRRRQRPRRLQRGQPARRRHHRPQGRRQDRTYTAPNGSEITVEILKVETYSSDVGRSALSREQLPWSDP